MSNSHLFMPSGFIGAPLKNGLGRYVPQLQRITLKFCKSWGGSRGMRFVSCFPSLIFITITLLYTNNRDFIETELMEFAKNNPGTVVYLKPRRHRSACLVAEYCKFNFSITLHETSINCLDYEILVNGEREYMSCDSFSKPEVLKWISYLTTRSGIPTMRFRRYQHTDYPTIQGVWTPFTHQAPEINLAQFPLVR